MSMRDLPKLTVCSSIRHAQNAKSGSGVTRGQNAAGSSCGRRKANRSTSFVQTQTLFVFLDQVLFESLNKHFYDYTTHIHGILNFKCSFKKCILIEYACIIVHNFYIVVKYIIISKLIYIYFLYYFSCCFLEYEYIFWYCISVIFRTVNKTRLNFDIVLSFICYSTLCPMFLHSLTLKNVNHGYLSWVRGKYG